MADLVRMETRDLGLMAATGAPALIQAFLAGRSPRTMEAYRADLEGFRSFFGSPSVPAAVEALLALPHGEANRMALAYRAYLLEAGLAPATVNRRLAALRSISGLARRLGFVVWSLEVENVRSTPYRDTRGPGVEGFRRLLEALESRGEADAKGKRDRAALRLLFDLGLRRAEVVALDVEDVDLLRSTVSIIGKGHREKTLLSLPAVTRNALAAWLEELGSDTGAVFVHLSRSSESARMRVQSLTRLVKDLGRGAGVPVTPHGLRHAAITRLLSLTNGDVTAVREFSRHADVRTVMIYDDRRQNRAGALADLLAQDSASAA
jgi:integrase/recombinase XerC